MAQQGELNPGLSADGAQPSIGFLEELENQGRAFFKGPSEEIKEGSQNCDRLTRDQFLQWLVSQQQP